MLTLSLEFHVIFRHVSGSCVLHELLFKTEIEVLLSYWEMNVEEHFFFFLFIYWGKGTVLLTSFVMSFPTR